MREALEQQAAEELATDLSGLADGLREKALRLEAKCTPRDWKLTLAFHATGSAKAAAEKEGTTPRAVHQAVYRVTQIAKAHGTK